MISVDRKWKLWTGQRENHNDISTNIHQNWISSIIIGTFPVWQLLNTWYIQWEEFRWGSKIQPDLHKPIHVLSDPITDSVSGTHKLIEPTWNLMWHMHVPPDAFTKSAACTVSPHPCCRNMTHVSRVTVWCKTEQEVKSWSEPNPAWGQIRKI